MQGMTNSGGIAAFKANEALTLAQQAKNTADEAKEAAEQGGGGGGGVELADVTSVSTVTSNGKVALTWTDPDDVVYNGATLARWAGTLVVRKEGSAPTSKTDGTVVLDNTTKNAYTSTAYEDSGLTNGTTYFYRFFPHTSGTYTAGTSVSAIPNKQKATISLIAIFKITNSNHNKKTIPCNQMM